MPNIMNNWVILIVKHSIYILTNLFSCCMQMFIKYVNYTDGIHEIEIIKSSSELGLEEPIFGDVVLKCRMDKSFHQLFLDCDINITANFNCDRCSEDYKSELVNNFKITYLFGKDESADKDNGVRYISHDVDKIDLTEDVVEYALLAIPMKKLCSNDCKGLCAICGNNLNEKKCDCKLEITNSIWEPLKKLKNNN